MQSNDLSFEAKLLDTIDRPTPSESLRQIDSLMYSTQMLWQHRSDKLYSPDIPFLVWLTNTFSAGKAVLPDNFAPKYGETPVPFSTVSHTEAARLCKENMYQWLKERTASIPKAKRSNNMLSSIWSWLRHESGS